ncbi:EexN family lipoprotein [Escherichia albertii]|uniref:EexN family lipoprotein n=1 Tax=Escherichia albertii TaxID=208962 RepID=UPI001A15D61D|nr:EexN family lipoprotein [Escherichia albertii]MCZ8935161.1 EexN family lipoprotein [Escherichia albertii]WDB86351.1 EexN family lipoprotein [Escherichia albertii]
MKKAVPMAFVSVLFLSGCNDKVYDVDYYFANQSEAKNVIEQCSQGKITNENCDNAKAAIQKQKREDWIKAHGGK